MGEGYSMYDKYNQRLSDSSTAAKESESAFTGAKAKFEQYHNDYITGKRNPIADIIAKPERDAEREKRLKEVAKWGVIGDAIGLIGKGWAASKGVKPLPTEGTTTFQALGKLNELDELYRQQGYRYDQMRLSEALRRQQSADNLAQYQLTSAERDYNKKQQDLMNTQNTADSIAAMLETRKYNESQAEKGRKWQEKQTDKAYERQLASAHGGGESDRLGAGEIALTYVEDGKIRRVTTGQYLDILNAAKASGIDPKIESGDSEAARKGKNDQVVAQYLKMQKEIIARDLERNKAISAVANDLKGDLYRDISVAKLRTSAIGTLFRDLNDDELVSAFKEYNIDVRK